MPKRFTLVGPNAGRTIKLGSSYDFIDGVYTFPGSDKDAERLAPMLGSYYSAHPDETLDAARGTYSALVDAQRADQALDEPQIVTEDEDEEADRLEAEALAKAEADAAAKAEADAAAKAEADAAAKAKAEADAAAKVEADAAAKAAGADEPKKTLIECIQGLDPNVNDNWTDRGLPNVEAVQEAFGSVVARRDIEAAAPGFNRAAAKAVLALA